MINEKDQVRLRDVVVWSEKAIAYLGETDVNAFVDNEMLKDACVRCLEVVGEAVAHLSDGFSDQYPDIPWSGAKGMRNILIHQYGSVDYFIVHETIVTFLPGLVAQVQNILSETSP